MGDPETHDHAILGATAHRGTGQKAYQTVTHVRRPVVKVDVLI
jgi:hypothetical protein